MTNPILTKEQAKFLEGQNISTFKGKFEVISKALEANNSGSDGFSINTEKEYEEFLTAVIIGKWDIERYVVNITQNIGIANFLSLSRDREGNIEKDSKGNLKWDVVDFADAERFSKEEIEQMVPEEYKNDVFILTESKATDIWGEEEIKLSTPKQKMDVPNTGDDNFNTTSAIRSVKGVLSTSA